MHRRQLASVDHQRTHRRVQGINEARQAPLPKELRPSDSAAMHLALAAVFRSRDRPDALFTANNAATIWAIEALRELKIEMGRDVALAGFDDVPFFSLITPPITAVSQPAADLGSISARLLLQRINGEFIAPGMRTTLPVSLMIRESCGCEKK